jgi:hypothetical protein
MVGDNEGINTLVPAETNFFFASFYGLKHVLKLNHIHKRLKTKQQVLAS